MKKKKCLIIVNLVLAILCMSFLVSCGSGMKNTDKFAKRKSGKAKDTTVYDSKDFIVSLLFEKKDDSTFSSGTDLGYNIELTAGDGMPENPYVFRIKVINSSSNLLRIVKRHFVIHISR